MASSEIEVVSDSQSAPNSTNFNGNPNRVLITDVFSASVYGDLGKLRRFVEEDGASVSKPDGNGYYALQWAALNNFAEIVHYLIERGGDVNAVDHARQTALHWAAVRGSIAVADLLVQSGGRVEAADVNGYRAVHVAAQYGQTAFLNHIVSSMAQISMCRIMMGGALFIGCTPLHWAAIRGNAEVCTVLVHTGTKDELTVKDRAGFTPAQIASDKGHRHVAFLLTNAQRRRRALCGGKISREKIESVGYAPILLFVLLLCAVIFINSIFVASTFTMVTAVVALWGWIAVSLLIASLIMFYRCSSKDPGYMKRSLGGLANHTNNEDPLLNADLSDSSIWMGNWSQLCPTCKIIRPVRSKHCPTCKRCVEQFDHHCPWISNCVGKKNKWDFFVFLCLGTLTSFISGAVMIERIWAELSILPASAAWLHHVVVHHPGAVLFVVLDALILIAAATLTIVQATQVIDLTYVLATDNYTIARNITTNEMANVIRYGYLRGPDGRFRNPYNHGCRKNCSDFLINGYTNDDEIAWPTLQQATN
ncbi:hypothetical protein Syun_013504 [Stephania yunnanensis]|uniref:S-acyltransferase n=1 Tax=Stephania yunnanensis TaxID=152371 RepID=A0AAP0JHP9_9MAGN